MSDGAVWSVFGRDGRLALVVVQGAGSFSFSRTDVPDGDRPPCAFASVQSYDAASESDVLRLLSTAHDLEDFFRRLRAEHFFVQPGRPRPDRFARL